MENGGLLFVGILILMFIGYTMLNPRPKKEKPAEEKKDKPSKSEPAPSSSSVRIKPGTYELNLSECIPADTLRSADITSLDGKIKFSVISDRQAAINIKANAAGTEPRTNAAMSARVDADSGCLAYTVSADGKSLEVAPPKDLKGVYLNGVYTEIPSGVSSTPFPVQINEDGTVKDPIDMFSPDDEDIVKGRILKTCKYKMIPGAPPACKKRVDINYSILENGRPVTIQELFARSFATSSPGITGIPL